MADKKSDKRSGAKDGDRPMRRRPSSNNAPASNDAPGRTAGAAPFRKRDAEKPAGRRDAKRDSQPRSDNKPRGAGKRTKPAPAPVEKTSAFAGERIAKAMARAGVCSRRDAEDWIAAGRVAVNGRVLTSAAVNVTETDRIEIDGAPMQARERTRLFLFHKPQGLVTTAADPEGRPTVFAYLDERHPDLPRLVSVGRLDINTEGLLLLTNDGGLARTLELPATGWTRRYRVRAHGDIDQARLDRLREGVTIDDIHYAPIDARLERVQGANAWIALALTEGKNREVKRVMEHLGLDVTRLIRVSYGPFQLGDLAEGAVEEVKLKVLRDQLGKSLAELAGVDFASPLREATPAEAQETRERLDKRPRKHVSVLREQRTERSEKGPRARIERSATADRKGRAVAVERVTPARPARKNEEESGSRNARRFEALRGEGRPPRRGEAAGAMERPRRAREESATRPARAGAGERRAPRGEGAWSERPARAPRAGAGPEGRAPRRPRDAGPRFDERPPRRTRDGDGGERFERRDQDGAQPSRDHARSRPRDGGANRFEDRRPRRDAEGGGGRPWRDAGPEGRPPRRPRDSGAGGERFERRVAGEGPAPRDPARGRPRDGGAKRFDDRSPRRDAGPEGRPPRRPRDSGAGGERFERRVSGEGPAPRGPARSRPRDGGANHFDERPPRRDAGPEGRPPRRPRDGGAAPDRAARGPGAGKAPPQGRGAFASESRGAPRKGPPRSRAPGGPGKGSGKGPGRGKPRGV
jgi:23S rRNA pseudouridine2605 synthase